MLTIVDFEVAATVAPAVALPWLEEGTLLEAGPELDARGIEVTGTLDAARLLDCAVKLA